MELIQQKQFNLDNEDFERLIVILEETREEIIQFSDVEQLTFRLNENGIKFFVTVSDLTTDKQIDSLIDSVYRIYPHNLISNWINPVELAGGGVGILKLK